MGKSISSKSKIFYIIHFLLIFYLFLLFFIIYHYLFFFYFKNLKVKEAHKLLEIWGELNKEQGLELLIGKYVDTKVREKAVSVLEKFTNQELAQYLGQLVQALRYEPYHDSSLARFLMKRAIKSKWKIGHYFLWNLKSGLHELSVQIRFYFYFFNIFHLFIFKYL